MEEMTTRNVNLIALAIGLVFSAGAVAQEMSADDYAAGKTNLAVKYKAERAGCASLSGNANDICAAEAKGNDRVAHAELEAGYRPGARNQYNVSVARAEAVHAVAVERCDDKNGNVKDVCVKEADAAETAAKANAKARMTTANADDKADRVTAEARGTAREKGSEARGEAAANKLDADYSVAKEKCDTYAGGAKDRCLDQANKSFGKS
jgi:hypothetical protein